ncbi:hypothetical protein A6A04_03735 [Paramagnetospirillum marisnigri]|uniref:Methyltransferase type 12 domain-containing protein n=2 Tax=Paramagnetospirillum marisnigri TaxID=1285242 RepID=A0A178MKN7_9PROT|nr:hypothetical protein A6A04_03735 [Paramagnetospirillum marisnigri]
MWPEHEGFVATSLGGHGKGELDLLDILSARILRLAGIDLDRFIESYRWLCGVFNEEQLYFVRNGRYRCSNFAEVNAAVYSNAEFMRKYMEGLLVSQLFWQNHARSFIFFNEFIKTAVPDYRYLEVGPGHGLYLASVAADSDCAEAEAWDVSAESLAQTRASLSRMGVERPVTLVEQDVQASTLDLERRFDIVVISEVLEHLEAPLDALNTLAAALAPAGRILVNFPINSPAPDHIYLLESLEQVVQLVEQAGLVVERAEAFPSMGYSLKRAMAVKATVSCAVVARLGTER